MITGTQKNYTTALPCVGSFHKIGFQSNNSGNSNFYILVNMTCGSVHSTFYLYPDINGYCWFEWNWLRSLFFQDPFLVDYAGTNLIKHLAVTDAACQIKQITLELYEYWDIPPQSGDYYSITTPIIYNCDMAKNGNDLIKPFINNKVYTGVEFPLLFWLCDNINKDNKNRKLYFDNNLIYSFSQANECIAGCYTSSYLKNLGYEKIKLWNVTDTDEYKINYIDHKGGCVLYFYNNFGGLDSYYFPTYNLFIDNIKHSKITTTPAWSTIGNGELFSAFDDFSGAGQKGITVETDILDDADAVAISQLLQSPFIFLKFNEPNTKYYRAVVKDNSFQIPNFYKNRLQTKTLTFYYNILTI